MKILLWSPGRNI